jgi:membrane-bound serine protease (ClpP class)
MKKILSLLMAGAIAPTLASASILTLRIDAPIHPVTSEYVVKALEKADAEGYRLVILNMNTPGGLDSSMREIIEKIVNSRVPVAAYVSPGGARAASAGFFIGVASDIFVMAPGTNTGAASPVGVSITGQAMDKTMEDKVTHDAASYIKTLAEKRGRNVQMAEDAVRKAHSYTETEALKGGLIDLVATSEQDILAHLHGRELRRFGGDMETLLLEGESIVPYPMTSRQKFLLTISNPNLAYLLFMLGLLGLYFEFSNPGAILPGVLGGISLLLAIFAFQILPINYVGLLLILLAAGLFILELKVQSYGILSVGGIVAMVIGSLMLIDAPIPELRPSLKIVIPVAVSISLIIIFLLTLIIRAHARRSVTGVEGMIGETGRAMTDLAPEGKVFVHGEIWAAEAAESVSKGARVRVVAFTEGLKIKVTKV